MRAVESENDTLKARPGSRSAKVRKNRLRQLALEGLEARTLLSTLPPVTTTSRTAISQLDGNTNTPSIAIDPNNPQFMVATWTRDSTQFPLHVGASVTTPVYTQAAYSTDGGNSWNALNFDFGNNVGDPSSPTSFKNLPAVTDASVAFDAHNNFYITDSPHTTTSGYVLLERFSVNPANNAITQTLTNGIVKSWATVDGAVFKPTLAVDANQTNFGGTQVDPAATNIYNGKSYGEVYVAWSTDLDTTSPFFQNSQVQLASSVDGGQSFGVRTLSGGFNDEASAPSIAISQGSAGVTGGQVSVVWDDTGNQINGRDRLMISTGNPQVAVNSSTGVISTPITDATNPGGTPTPSVTKIPLAVSGANFSLSKLTATISLTHPNLSELLIQLQAPDGTLFTLLNNAVNPAGTAISPAQGISGANLGLTTFDDAATNTIDQIGGATSAGGTFRADGGLLTRAFNRSQLNGTWNLVVTDEVPDSSPTQSVNSFSLSLTGSSFTSESSVLYNGSIPITTAVHGVIGGGVFPNSGSIAAEPNGFGPAPMIVSDNTLGGNSAHQGRLYLVYVGNDGGLANNSAGLDNQVSGTPASDTSIMMSYSDNGGASWSFPTQVSDADGSSDGFSGAGLAAGRPAFAPQVAVDPTTGTVVVSYLDTRNDPSQARVATYINASIDGGNTWSAGNYANASQTATNAITGTTANLGPIPDNQSTGNTVSRDATYGFGDHMGLAVFGGNIYPVWPSNANGGNDGNQNNGGVLGGLGIVVGHTQTAAGPRVIGATTGPIGELANNNGVTVDPLNTTRNTSFGPKDGGPMLTTIAVTFDRAIDPTSIGTDNFTFTYADTLGNVTTLPAAAVTGVAVKPGSGNTIFNVSLDPQYGWKVGTYSYTIAPTVAHPVNSLVKYFNGTTLVTSEGMDQGADVRSSGNSYAVPTPATSTQSQSSYYASLPIIVPGPHVINSVVQNLNPGATDNEVLNNTASYITVTFDRAITVSSFTVSSIVRIMGPAGQILATASSPFTVTAINATTVNGKTAATQFRVGFPTQTLSGTYTITLASTITDTLGDQLDTNLNAGLYALRGGNNSPYTTTTPNVYPNATAVAIPVATASNAPTVITSTITVPNNFVIKDGVAVQVNITFPTDSDLTATLVGPDGQVINGVISGTNAILFAGVGAPGAGNFSNTILQDNPNNASISPIASGAAPFFGTYDPQQSLNVAFANGSYSSLGPNGAGTGIWTLVIKNASTTNSGTLNSWTLTLPSQPTGTGLGEPVADQPSLGFRIFVDAPSNTQSGNTWTSVGPSPLVSGVPDGSTATKSGQVSAIAVDPSDPSGNTVFAAGSTGGVWKTTNFLTSNPNGPTWIPLTDFGPTAGINVGTITVFPRGNDPTQSIVFVGLGDPDSGKPGYGFLRSTDGGAHWALLDSTNNNLPFASRDHLFSNNATLTYQIAVDPTLNSNNQQVIVYAALGGSSATAGLWRSLDSGQTWTPIKRDSGPATSVTLDPLSGLGVQGGNLQIVYAGFPGVGVFSSPNQGQSWFQLLGTAGDPLIQDINSGQKINVNAGPAPAGASGGKILLLKPSVLDNASTSIVDKLYEGWLYALVANTGGLDGLYVTKDFGQNWTKVDVQALVNPYGTYGSNDTRLSQYGAGVNASNVSFAIDPTNPNVVYIGGGGGGARSGFLRVDTTTIVDPHDLVAFSQNSADGGTLQVNSTGGVSVASPAVFPSAYLYDPLVGSTIPVAYLDLIRDPYNVFGTNSTLRTYNVTNFTNSGAGAKIFTYYPYSEGDDPDSALLDDSNDQHALVTEVDPQTGHARLILGDSQGIFTGVDLNGTMIGGVGNVPGPLGSRNGNLAITQFFYGAVQPSAHTNTGTPLALLYYGGAKNVGLPVSDGSVASNGDITWTNQVTTSNPNAANTYVGADGYSEGVATDPTGTGTVYRVSLQYGTNFFQVQLPGSPYFISRTFGLTTGPADPTWFGVPLTYNNGLTTFGNFTVNSVNGQQVLISSANGTIYRTENLGQTWFAISNPSQIASYASALAFGAPDPTAPNGIGNLDNFLYAGTLNGKLFVTNTGGGSVGNGNNWIDISAGLDGSTVQQIIPDPTRGTHDAYAITLRGVYYMANSLAANATWQNITNNLPQLTIPAYGDTTAVTPQLSGLTSLQVDWRYAIPNASPQISTPNGTHPVLYVAGNSGVYRSYDDGLTWGDFPSADPSQDAAPVNGGYLPNVQVNSLSLAIGNVNPQTGQPNWQPANQPTGSGTVADPNILVATTYGRGQFQIELTPTVLPNVNQSLPGIIALDSTSLLKHTNSGTDVSNTFSPIIDGVSEASGVSTSAGINGDGMTVKVLAYVLTDSNNNLLATPILVTPLSATTDANGKYKLQLVNAFTQNGTYTIGIQATDQLGAKGNMAKYTFVVDSLPNAPTGITLDPSTDSGTYNGDDYTLFNNSLADHSNAPVFDVSGILPGATVYLLRATETGGVAPTAAQFSVVGSAVNTGGANATVLVADTNAGNGQIADTPVNTLIDTAPPQPNQYVYMAYQVDTLNVQGPNSASPGLPVIIDTTPPAPPKTVTLDPSSDSGASNTDNYTKFNNSLPDHSNAPVFDVTGIEPHATVILYRNGVEVNRLVDVTPVNTLNGNAVTSLVQIPDLNTGYGGGTIPDSPLGTPVDTAPPSGNPYTYTAVQIDLAGNVSQASTTFGNRGAIVIDGTDSDHHGDFNAGTGLNEDGWLYMQNVITAIAPNISNGHKVLVALGVDPSIGGGDFTATGAIASAFAKSSLGAVGSGWSVVYVTGAANIGKYLSGQAATALTSTNTAAGTVTIGQTGFLYITTANHTGDDLTDAELAVIDQHGPDIASYVNTGGGLYTQAETVGGFGGGGGSGAVEYGWLSSLFTGVQTVSAQSNPTNIQLTAAGHLIFPNLQAASLTAGPWHTYFTGNFPASLVPVITDTNPNDLSNPLDTVVLGLSSVGAGGGPPAGDLVTIDSTAPAVSTISLDPSTPSGVVNGVLVIKANNSPTPSNAPVFDITGVEPNALVNLYRAPVVNGNVGTAQLVNSFTQTSGGGIVTITMADINAANAKGTIADGTYVYTTQQTDLAGNVGAISNALKVQILTNAPAAPNPFTLDPGSDTGTFTNDFITRDNNGLVYPAPTFDASGVVSNNTLELFRATYNPSTGVTGTPTLVNTLTHVTSVSPFATITDTNAGNGQITDGTYVYTAVQVDLAGNVSPFSTSVRVTINAAPPQPSPFNAPVLDVASQTGPTKNPAYTQDNNGNPFPPPTFDVGSVATPVPIGSTVELFRAPYNPQTKTAGTPVLVNSIVNVQSGSPVMINDTNAGSGKIADGTYLYYDVLVSIAGVPGVMSKGTQITIQTGTPVTPSPFVLDAASDTGYSNSDDITQVTLFHAPLFDASGVLPGASLLLFRAPVVNGVTGAATQVNRLNGTTGGTVSITDPTSPADGLYTYTVEQIDLAGNPSPIGGALVVTYDTSQPPTPPSPTLDPASTTGAPGSNQTSNTAPFFNVALTLNGFESGSSITLVRDGVVVNQSAYNATTGTAKIQDPGPVSFGVHVYKVFLTDKAGNVGALSGSVSVTFAADSPGAIVLDPGSDTGVLGDGITKVTSPSFDVTGVKANATLRLLRNGLIVASIPTGTGGTLTITDPGPVAPGTYSYAAQQVDSLGNVSPPGPAISITIDTTTPLAPTAFKLDPASDSGLKGDGITNVVMPTFDASGILPGATVNLLRDGILVSSLTAPAAVLGGPATVSVVVTDPGSNSPVLSGAHTYKVQQISIAGNASPFSVPQVVTIISSKPPAPTITLDPASDSGIKGDGVTNVTAPAFDASGVISNASLTLFRDGVAVATLPSVGTVAPGATVLIQDPGPLAGSVYHYSVQQTDVAGNVGLTGASISITISTTAPATPNTPQIYLDPSTDTGIKGDRITSARYPVISGYADPNDQIVLFNGNGTTIGTTIANSQGSFSIPVTTLEFNGYALFQAQATDANNHVSKLSASLAIKFDTTEGDFTGTGKTSLALLRTTAASINWFVKNYTPITNDAFGVGSIDVAVTGDFNGAGRLDPVIYRPSTGQWFIQNPGNGYNGQVLNSGYGGPDYVPIPGNYNGSAVDQLALYKTTTGQFFVLGNPKLTNIVPYQAGDIPVPGNYDNVDRDEFALYRPSNGTWYILGSGGTRSVVFGNATDVPVPGMYDATAANHSVEPAVWRPGTGQFLIDGPNGTRTYQFAVGDIPIPGDYDGIGVTEPAVYRTNSSGGTFLVWGPNDKAPRVLASFGGAADIPVISPYSYRQLKPQLPPGGVAALGVSAESVNLGATAAGLSSSGVKQTNNGLVLAPVGTTPAAQTVTVASVQAPLRVRPNQAITELIKAQGQSHHQKQHVVDHALASLNLGRKHRSIVV